MVNFYTYLDSVNLHNRLANSNYDGGNLSNIPKLSKLGLSEYIDITF